MEREAAMDRQGGALQRILFALAAMAGLLDAARFSLPPEICQALLRPLRSAEASAQSDRRDPRAAARLRLQLLLICRVIDRLIRHLLRSMHNPLRSLVRIARRSRADRHDFPGWAPGVIDSS